MIDETWGDPSPIETDPENREFNSGPLVVGRITFERRPMSIIDEGFSGEAFGSFPFYRQPCPVSKHRMEVDDLNREYQTQAIHVDKRTHRIRYENESEHEVTVVIEPKTS